MKTRLRMILGPIIIAATLVAFAYYLHGHPHTIDHIRQLPPGTIVVLLGLNIISFLALILMTRFSLRVYHKKMQPQENLLFNAYSSLVNFFGPGQSGPAFRGVYLKKKHGLEYKKYLFVTLIYYGIYAVISAFFMFVGSRPWWQTALLMVVVAVGSGLFIRRYKRRASINATADLSLANIARVAGATVLQLTAMAVAYGVELHAVGAHVSISQILAYTGVANFSLFVALTPGAIGIREGFLIFSQQLHHIDNATIVAANVVDRAVYLAFLGLLFTIVISLHAKDKLQVKQMQPDQE